MSLFRALIQVQVKQKRCNLEIDVIDGEMTLLISEEDLGVMGVDILCTRRTLAINGEVQDVCMREPGSLHIVLPLVDEQSSGQKAAFQSNVGYESCPDKSEWDAGMSELSRVDDVTQSVEAVHPEPLPPRDQGYPKGESGSVNHPVLADTLAGTVNSVDAPPMKGVSDVGRSGPQQDKKPRLAASDTRTGSPDHQLAVLGHPLTRLTKVNDLVSELKDLYHLVIGDAKLTRGATPNRYTVMGHPDHLISDEDEADKRAWKKCLFQAYWRSHSGRAETCVLFWKPQKLWHVDADCSFPIRILAVAKTGDHVWFDWDLSTDASQSASHIMFKDLKLDKRFHLIVVFFTTIKKHSQWELENVKRAAVLLTDTSRSYAPVCLWIGDDVKGYQLPGGKIPRRLADGCD